MLHRPKYLHAMTAVLPISSTRAIVCKLWLLQCVLALTCQVIEQYAHLRGSYLILFLYNPWYVRMQFFSVDNNQLTGTIPTSWSKHRLMRSVGLNNNEGLT